MKMDCMFFPGFLLGAYTSYACDSHHLEKKQLEDKDSKHIYCHNCGVKLTETQIEHVDEKGKIVCNGCNKMIFKFDADNQRD